MKLFNRSLKSEAGEATPKMEYMDSAFVAALLGQVVVTRETVMSIPILKRSINFIADTISSLEWHLYEKENSNIIDRCDYRTDLLNKESNSNIKSSDIIKNMIIDYLIYGSAYANMKKRLNHIEAIQYVNPDYVSTSNLTIDHLNPVHHLYVDGREVNPYDYIILMNGGTNDGLQGLGGIINTDRELVELAFLTSRTMKNITNCSKSVVNVDKQLTEKALAKLRADIKSLSDADAGTLVLNKGVSISEVGRSSVDNQFVQMYEQIQKQLTYVLGIPLSVLDGTCSDEVYNQTIKSVVLPMISILEKAFSDSMLLIAEKPNMEFKIDTNGLLRTSTKERYDAYAVGIKSGFLSRNDVRRKENMDVIEGLDLYSYSLADVLYDPKSKTYQIFNKGEIASFEKGGGEKSETTN